MPPIKYLLSLVMLATLFSSAFAIHCFHCDSEEDPDCGEIFEPVGRPHIDCSASKIQEIVGNYNEISSCMKITKRSDHGGFTVQRSCDIYDNDCPLDYHGLGTCYLCKGDLCNSSSSMMPVVFTIVSFFSAARFIS